MQAHACFLPGKGEGTPFSEEIFTPQGRKNRIMTPHWVWRSQHDAHCSD